MKIERDEQVPRRTYLMTMALLEGAAWPLAVEAVATVALEHPEWDMNEKRSWDEWDRA